MDTAIPVLVNGYKRINKRTAQCAGFKLSPFKINLIDLSLILKTISTLLTILSSSLFLKLSSPKMLTSRYEQKKRALSSVV